MNGFWASKVTKEKTERFVPYFGRQAKFCPIEIVHPAIGPFGLWQDEADLETLVSEIYANHQNQGIKAGIEW